MSNDQIPRYQLLVREIIKNTTNRFEKEAWEEIHQRISYICDKVNRSNESREDAMKILELQDNIQGLPEALLEPWRKLKCIADLFARSNCVRHDRCYQGHCWIVRQVLYNELMDRLPVDSFDVMFFR